MPDTPEFHGGERVADVLRGHGVPFLFTLCGGHISPILVACKRQGIRVVDVRHEATAVFAADAVARLTGIPGVAAVTAGPGLSNTVTAVKNAQMAQSPVIVLGGATATVLKGRGSLQDIDQFALMRPHVKWAASARRVRDIAPLIEHAFAIAPAGVPGPVFIELPVDLLYPQSLVRRMYGVGPDAKASGLGPALFNAVLRHHVRRMFRGAERPAPAPLPPPREPPPLPRHLRRAARMLDRARRPLLLLGSQATLAAGEVAELRAAVESLAVPVYLTGMGRGLLGRNHTLQLRHQRKEALRQADLVILAGVPMDFRLDYGRNIATRARVIALNRSTEDLTKNRRPSLAALGDAAGFLRALATRRPMGHWQRPDWLRTLHERDQQREREIDRQAAAGEGGVNPIALCRRLEDTLGEDCILVGDGGDFVATASYVVRPRGPLTWLDPGVFGTLGSGAGFALGAKLARPKSDVWILYGDGSVGYTLPEFDTFVRHHVPIIGVVGNDGGWQQIAREQVEMLGDPVGTELPQADYHKVAQGFGAEGLLVSNDEQCGPALRRARELSRTGAPVLVNALCRRTAFRKGSVSI